MQKTILALFLFISTVQTSATTVVKDSTNVAIETTEQAKTGYSIIPLPDLRFDPYAGARIGAIVYLYNFGDGSRYPNVFHSTRLIASYGLKGATDLGVEHIRYGDKIFSGELIYRKQIAAPFFGLNGYQQVYNESFMDLNPTTAGLPQNPLFYNTELQSLDLTLSLQDTIKNTYFNWLAGFDAGFYNIKDVDLVSVNRKNKKAPGDHGYIDPNAESLYGLNKKWGLIDSSKTEGGRYYATLRGALIYDKRSRLINPMKGILAQAGLDLGLNTFGVNISPNVNFAQYITLVKKRLSFAYRFRYRGTFGKTPFLIQEGVGGTASAWGVHLNRAIVKQWATGQFELRLRAWTWTVGKTTLDFWGGPFLHTGYVIQKNDFDLSQVSSSDNALYFNQNYGKWYTSIGHAGKMVINKNLALGFDLAIPIQKQAGPPLSIFVGLEFSF